MARVFNGTTQYLEHAGACITSFPATFAGWIYLDSSTDLSYGPGVYDSGSGGGFWHIRHANTEGWGAFWAGSTMSSYRLQGSNSTAGWHHVAGSWSSANAPSLYVDGSSITGTASNGSGTITVNRTGVQTNRYLGTRFYGKGRNAEQAIWKVALDAAEVMALYRGYTPLDIRPASLVAYWPLGGHYGQSDVDRWNGGFSLTPSGSPTWADHYRVRYPQPAMQYFRAATGGGATPWLYARRRSQIIGAGGVH